jgi:glycosyltransferase involved in cell wall biosynthesis
MRIGIITAPLDERHPSYSVYTCNLIKNLNLLDRENEYFLIHHTEIDLDVYKVNKQVIIPQMIFKPLKGRFWKYFLLPEKLRKMDLDLVHDPSGTGFPLLSKTLPFKKVITVHALFSLIFPTFNIKAYIAWKFLGKKSMDGADKIIAISNFLKRELVRHLKVPENKIQVIYNGTDERFRPLSQKEVEEVKRQYGLEFPFILHVGGILNPAKNISTLVNAFYRLSKKGLKHKLVIVGKKGAQFDQVSKTVEKLGLQKTVVFLGYIPHEDLPKIYNAADLFVFPSVYEGFGLPPLEAMACGIPVITSNMGALPEVVGDAGILVNPFDIDGLTKAICEVLENEDLRQDIIRKGIKRAQLFSWKRNANEVLKLYKELLNK